MRNTRVYDWQALYCQILRGNSVTPTSHGADLGITIFWGLMVYNLKKNRTVCLRLWREIFPQCPPLGTKTRGPKGTALGWGLPALTYTGRDCNSLHPLIFCFAKKGSKEKIEGLVEEHGVLGGECQQAQHVEEVVDERGGGGDRDQSWKQCPGASCSICAFHCFRETEDQVIGMDHPPPYIKVLCAEYLQDARNGAMSLNASIYPQYVTQEMRFSRPNVHTPLMNSKIEALGVLGYSPDSLTSPLWSLLLTFRLFF